MKSIVAQIRDTVVDEVYISYPRSDTYYQQIDGLLSGLEQLGLPVRVAAPVRSGAMIPT